MTFRIENKTVINSRKAAESGPSPALVNKFGPVIYTGSKASAAPPITKPIPASSVSRLTNRARLIVSDARGENGGNCISGNRLAAPSHAYTAPTSGHKYLQL
mmetsp:Transcript_21793/g.22167  ORF Transcript_21793/g.22167 Transcript_21793/m.22167 type:complete len:102 (+) Transcript_21793:227-532(+)